MCRGTSWNRGILASSRTHVAGMVCHSMDIAATVIQAVLDSKQLTQYIARPATLCGREWLEEMQLVLLLIVEVRCGIAKLCMCAS